MPDLRHIATRHRKSLLISFIVLLLLRSRLLKLPQDVIRKLSGSASDHKLSPEELAQVLQQVYVEEKDGSKTLLVPNRDGVSKVRQSPLLHTSYIYGAVHDITPIFLHSGEHQAYAYFCTR